MNPCVTSTSIALQWSSSPKNFLFTDYIKPVYTFRDRSTDTSKVDDKCWSWLSCLHLESKSHALWVMSFRPTPEEAAQWRESLDRVLTNSCKYTIHPFIHVFFTYNLWKQRQHSNSKHLFFKVWWRFKLACRAPQCGARYGQEHRITAFFYF